MKPFHVFFRDFRFFIKQPMLIITFIAVAFIPSLYSGFLIKGTWDPYGQLQDLPIAVVNLDRGADFQGEMRVVGNEFVQTLKKDQTFAWQFVNDQDAKQGMENNRYYATITIPPEFSKDAASLAGDHPKQAEIIYESNSYYNFVAGQISESATKELRNKLSKSLSEAYSRSLFSQFETISTGFSTASVGASQLHNGTSDLRIGLTKVNKNLIQLAKGADKLSDGVTPLQSGVTKLRNGISQVKKGASDLSNGANQLATAAGLLQQGAEKTVDGSSRLKNGIQSSKSGADKLVMGLESTNSGAKQLEGGLTAAVSASRDLSDGSARVAAGLEQVMKANPTLSADPEMQKLLAASKAVSNGANQLATGQKQLLAGSQVLSQGQQQLLEGSRELSQGQGKLLNGVTELHAGQVHLSEGLKQYNSKYAQFASGVSKLDQGTVQLSLGAEQLESGIDQLGSGIRKVASGANQLEAGTSQLNSGATKLEDGSGQLEKKLTDAANETSAIKANDQMIEMLTEPVTIKANDDRKVKLYANGIAPYFLSIALFAGSLVFTTIFSARNSTGEVTSFIQLFISKILTFGLVSLAQTLLVSTIIVFGLGLKVQSIPVFYLFTMLVGLTFMFVIQAFVTWLDQPGRFLVLVLMILQLSSSAGTFPLELLPNWAQVWNPLLPMTYSILGYREVISSGDFRDLLVQAAHLALYNVIFIPLTFAYFWRNKKGTSEEQLMPMKI
jgi:putative membrane protein